MAGFGMKNKQTLAINALLSTTSVVEAANKAYIPERTLRRWLTDYEFLKALKDAQGEVINEATRGLLSRVNKAIHTIDSLMDDGSQRGASIQLRSANCVLEQSIRFYENMVLAERINKLERMHEDEKPE